MQAITACPLKYCVTALFYVLFACVQQSGEHSGSISDASEDDTLDYEDTDKVDNGTSSGYLQPRLSAPTGPDGTISFGTDSELDRAKNGLNEDVFERSSSATLPSHVKLLVNELESRYSARDSPRTHPPPASQSCSKIATLQQSLLSRVQDTGVSRTASPVLENCPKVTAVRDGLMAKVRVPETSKVSTPMLISCPKITALQETLISRVQNPGTSHWTVERNLADCPSVASRQTALLGATGQTPAQRQPSVTTPSPPRDVALNHSDEAHDGLPNSRDGPEIE